MSFDFRSYHLVLNRRLNRHDAISVAGSVGIGTLAFSLGGIECRSVSLMLRIGSHAWETQLQTIVDRLKHCAELQSTFLGWVKYDTEDDEEENYQEILSVSRRLYTA